MNQGARWSRRMFLEAAALVPAAGFLLRASAQEQALEAMGDLELTLPSLGGAPPLRLLGRRIFNCYAYLASLARREGGVLTTEERKFERAARQLERILNPFERGLHAHFELGMVDAGSEAELLMGLERQARLYATGVSAAVGAALATYEKEIWPRHRALIAETLPLLEKHFGSEKERLVATLAARLGLRKLPPQLTVSLVVPHIVRDSSSQPIVVSLTALHGNDLIERLLEELIHELATENAEESGAVGLLLEEQLAAKRVSSSARLRVIGLFESWVAGELVRERVSPEHVPTATRQQQFETLARTYNLKLSEPLFRSVWMNYLEGRMDLPSALRQLVEAML